MMVEKNKKESSEVAPRGAQRFSIPRNFISSTVGGALPDLRISRRDVFYLLALFVLVAVIYFPATRAGFVWDDSIMRDLRAVST